MVDGDNVFTFGGRLSTRDLQNVVRLDMKTLTCSEVELEEGPPKGRRKSGVCLHNKLLFVHSGFNGDYVDDFLCFNLLERPEEVELKETSEDWVNGVLVTQDVERAAQQLQEHLGEDKITVEGDY